jgi:hypothetical protein
MIVRIRLFSLEPVELLDRWRPIGAIEKAQHLVKRPVFQHEHDDVIDLVELIGHLLSPEKDCLSRYA